MINNYFLKTSEAIKNLKNIEDDILRASNIIIQTFDTNHKLLVVGNGGSCSDAEHFVGELLCTFNKKNRRGLPAISIPSNPTAMTAWSNDFEFNSFYSRQVESLSSKGDTLFLISTGGGSQENNVSINLINALNTAKQRDCNVISLVGKSGGYLKENSDCCIHVKDETTSIIQECYITILHYICYMIDNNYS